MERKTKSLVIVTAIITLLLGAMIGFLAGQNKASVKTASNDKLTAEETKQLIDTAYPAPAAEMYSLSGTVLEIKDGQIMFEIYHPDDYLPTADRRKQTRTIVIVEGTEIVEIDYSAINPRGEFNKKPLTLADLKPGDIITANAGGNIKYADRFEAKQIIKAKQ